MTARFSKTATSGSYPLSRNTNYRYCVSAQNMSRVMFLTDMESGLADEEAVIAMAKSSAMKKRIHTTVVGVGVDLSVGTGGSRV